MSWRDRTRRALPYVIAALSGFALAYLLLFFFVFRPSVVPDTGQVPDVVGMDLETARQRLESAGFDLQRGNYRVDPTVAKGAVAAQSPGGGSALERGGKVVVTVSAGQPTEAAPAADGRAPVTTPP